MKIAILSPFYPFRGGLAQLNARLYTELSMKNEVRAYSFTTLYPKFLFPGKTQFLEKDDTSALVIENERVLNSINPFSYIKTAKRINKFAPDVIIIPYWMSYLAPAFGSVCRLLKNKTKVVSLVHNAFPHEKSGFDKQLGKYFFNTCDAFITMSDVVRDNLLSLKPKANILLQDHPIYDHYKEKIDRNMACKQLNIAPDKRTILFFGFIREYKGLDLLIKAFGKLDSNYQLVIAGECYGSFDKYQELIDNCPNKENICLLNKYISDDLVPILFSASDALILPYRSATQSGVIGIAYQLETPIIATNVGALKQTIEGANTGYIIDKPQEDCITEGIEAFFTRNRALYLQNVRKEKTRLSWSSFTQSVESYILSI